MSSDITIALKSKVQQLADRLHQAKRDLDWHQYNWAGLDDPQVRATTMDNWRRSFQTSPIKKEIERKAAAYRKARQAYIAAKAELDELMAGERIERSIQSTRAKMHRQYAPEMESVGSGLMMGGESFDLSRRPKLVQAMTENVRTAVQQMRSERSVPSVVAVVETLAAVDQMGYDTVRPAERRDAWNAAQKCAVELRDRMRQQINPAIPEQRKRLIRLEVLVQHLGG